MEFSETRGTPMFNSKLDPETFVNVVEHISEGHSVTSITRTCHVHHDTVERIARVTAKHAQAIHEAHVRGLKITGLQADERYGFAGTKSNPFWEAILPVRCMVRIKNPPLLLPSPCSS